MVERILTAAAGLPTTGSIDTPIGTLEISNGYPTEVTTRKLFDEMDFQRAVQAYLWALPMIGSGIAPSVTLCIRLAGCGKTR